MPLCDECKSTVEYHTVANQSGDRGPHGWMLLWLFATWALLMAHMFLGVP